VRQQVTSPWRGERETTGYEPSGGFLGRHGAEGEAHREGREVVHLRGYEVMSPKRDTTHYTLHPTHYTLHITYYTLHTTHVMRL